MVPVYLQQPHRPQTRTLRGFAAETAKADDVIEQFCLGQNFSRITVNRGERCWVVVVLDHRVD